MKNNKILFIDDDRIDRMTFERYAKKHSLPFDYTTADSLKEAKKILNKKTFDAILADFELGDGTAFELFERTNKTPIIIITGSGDEEVAVQAMKSGASDYIIKDPEGNYLKTIQITIENAIKNNLARIELEKYRNHLEDLVKERTAALQNEIKERKKTDAALKKSEIRYRAIVENSPILIFRFLPDDGTITFVNDSYCKYFNKDRSELLGHSIFDLVTEEDRPRMIEQFSSLNRTNPTLSYEYRIHTPNGERWHRWTNQALFDENNKIVEFQATGEDITNEKKLEQQLQQSQKMEAIGQLAGGIAHDFNNILTVINGYSELALLNAKKARSSTTDLSVILSASKKASDLTRKLLIFSRQEIIEPKIIDINKIIIDLDKMLRRLISEDIIIEKKLFDDVLRIKADPLQIEQIMINLIVNARDAINQLKGKDKTKKITIETGNIDIDEKYVNNYPECKAGKYVYFSITDNGIGMDEEIKSKIFEPFFSTKTKEQGTGLGLSTVYGIIKQNDAAITVDSKPGKGTTFKIYWPYDKSAERLDTEYDNNVDLIGGHERILLVEDDPQVRNIAYNSLKSLGYDVYKASNGVDALNMYNKNKIKIDLLISDIVMPKLGGKELAEKLYKIDPKIKILFTSGYIDDQKLRNEILNKKVNFIYKPFSFHSIAHKVRDVLDT